MKKPIVYENVSLKAYNTFGLDYEAKYFTTIAHVSELQSILSEPTWKQQSKLILGDGSNILLTQSISGLVIHNKIMGIKICDDTSQHVLIKIGAGENWHQFVMYCVQHHYAGIENLSLIPGTVGAAPIQNIGAYGVELKNTLHEISAISIEGNTEKIFTNEDCQFGYRDSIFKQALKNKYVITHVTLRLNKTPTFHVKYGAVRETLEAMQVEHLSIRAISEAVIKIRQEKLPDPKKIGNAGSFFKNPIVSQTIFEHLQKQFPRIPFFQEKNALIKIPAAWLIEQCGWKGKRIGPIGVHEKQALVLINEGHGDGLALKNLNEAIQRDVYQKFGITLQPEVSIL